MNKKQHTRDKLFNTGCENCEDRAHSLNENFTFVDLSIREEPFKIVVRSKVCLRCGPVLIFEVPEQLANMLEEALQIAGYDLSNENLEIQRV